jgi:hypothetical protein
MSRSILCTVACGYRSAMQKDVRGKGPDPMNRISVTLQYDLERELDMHSEWGMGRKASRMLHSRRERSR